MKLGAVKGGGEGHAHQMLGTTVAFAVQGMQKQSKDATR